jgi:uncharacterized protein (TIGR01244 family)
MDIIRPLTLGYAVTGVMQPDDFADAARRGFRSVISHRPDGEEPGQLTAVEEAALAAAAGLAFRHIPVSKVEQFSNAVVDGTAGALAELPGPILAHCKSGLRSAIAWAAVTARVEPVDAVIATAARAGLSLEPIRDELEAQAEAR